MDAFSDIDKQINNQTISWDSIDKARQQLSKIEGSIGNRMIVEKELVSRLQRHHPGESARYYEMNVFFDPPPVTTRDERSPEVLNDDGQNMHPTDRGDEGRDGAGQQQLAHDHGDKETRSETSGYFSDQVGLTCSEASLSRKRERADSAVSDDERPTKRLGNTTSTSGNDPGPDRPDEQV